MNTATAKKLDDDVLLTPKEAAAILQLSISTLSSWRLSGKHGDTLPYIKVGRSVRYRKSAIDNFLEISARTHT